MKVKVIKKHPSEWEVIQFPTFKKGSTVELDPTECSHFKNWFPCVIEGWETFIPASYVSDGILNRDYNPTELEQEAGDVLTVKEIANAWLVAENESGISGWIPAEVVVTAGGPGND